MLESINNRPKQNTIKMYIEILVIESTLLTTTLPGPLYNNETCKCVSDVACDVSSCGEKLMKVLTDYDDNVLKTVMSTRHSVGSRVRVNRHTQHINNRSHTSTGNNHNNYNTTTTTTDYQLHD